MPFQFSTDEEARFIQLTPAYINAFLDIEAFKIPPMKSQPHDLSAYENGDLMLLLKSINEDGLISYLARYRELGGEKQDLEDFLAYLLQKLTACFPENDMTGNEFFCHMNALLQIIQACGLDIENTSLFYQLKVDLLRLSIIYNPIESIGKIDTYFSTLDEKSINDLAHTIIVNHPEKATALFLKLEEKLQLMQHPNGLLKYLYTNSVIDLFQCLNTLDPDSDQNKNIIETEQFFFRFMEFHRAVLPPQEIKRIKDMRDNPYLRVALFFAYNNEDADIQLTEMPKEEKLIRVREALMHQQYHVVCSMARHISANDLASELARMPVINMALAQHIRKAWDQAPFLQPFYYQAALAYRYYILLYSRLPPPYDESMLAVLAKYPPNHLSEQELKIYLIAIASLIEPNFLDQNRLFSDFFPDFQDAFTEDLQKSLLPIMYEYRTTIFAASGAVQNKPYLSLMSFMAKPILLEFALSESVKNLAFLKIIETALGTFVDENALQKSEKLLISKFYLKMDSLLAEEIDKAATSTTEPAVGGGKHRRIKKPGRKMHDASQSSSVLESATNAAEAVEKLNGTKVTPPLSPHVEDHSLPTSASSSVTSVVEFESFDSVTDLPDPVDLSKVEVVIEGSTEKNTHLRKQNAALRREIELLTTESIELQRKIYSLNKSNTSLTADLKNARSKEAALKSELTLTNAKITEIRNIQGTQNQLLKETKDEKNILQSFEEERYINEYGLLKLFYFKV